MKKIIIALLLFAAFLATGICFPDDSGDMTERVDRNEIIGRWK